MNVLRRGAASIRYPTEPVFATTYIPHKAAHHTITRARIITPLSPAALPSYSFPATWSLRVRRPASTSRHLSSEAVAQRTEVEQDGEAQIGPITRFRQLGDQKMVSQTIVDTLVNDMGLEDLTEVQAQAIPECMQGQDCVAQARTGTGKTLAFLLPIIQNIIDHAPELEHRSRSRNESSTAGIRALIISPTRELAEQIHSEAVKVTRNTGILVKKAVGGTNKFQGLREIRHGCNLLVGTPGRLKDLLSDADSGVEAPDLRILVLDEADRLLEQGFEDEIREIQRLLPDKRQVDRQTLLFSATMPRDVMPVVRTTMKRNFKFIQTVRAGEQQTHERVPQKAVNVGGMENYMPTLLELCLREMQNAALERPFKAIVFCPTLSEVSLTVETLRLFGLPRSTQILELYSKLSQYQRTAAADKFKRAKSAILVASDVAARGMDFPDVTHVIQLGLPPSEEQYIHRIGRTARAGKSGEAWLLFSDLDRRELRSRLGDMPLKTDTTLVAPTVNVGVRSEVPQEVSGILEKLKSCMDQVPSYVKARAYVGIFGQHQGYQNKQRLVDAANARALHGFNLREVPLVSMPKATRLGLSRLSGLRFGQEEREPETGSSYNRGRNSRSGFSRDFEDRGSPRNRFGRGSGQRIESREYGRRDSRYAADGRTSGRRDRRLQY